MISKHNRQYILKIIFVIFASLLIIFATVIIFISPLTKFLVEKYDKEYTGREITMDWAYVNPFSGYIYFDNVKIYEVVNDTLGTSGDSIFISADGISADIAIFKLFSKTYEISEISLEHPRGIVIQNKDKFNFNDLILRFSSDKDTDTNKAPIHFNILNIKINGGEFYYREELIPINYYIKNVNLESTGKRWDTDTIAVKFLFQAGVGTGDVKGDITINFENLDYKLSLLINKYSLQIIEQYLKEMSNNGCFSAILFANIKATGNFLDAENINTNGKIAIKDFHFGKNKNNDYASFDKLFFDIIELSPVNHIYFCDTVFLSHPYFKYERYDYLDNLQTMFGKDGANITATNANTEKFNLVIEIANYVKLLSKNFFQSDYKINRLAINDGDFRYVDYSIFEKFSINLSPLSVASDSIDKDHKRVKMLFKTGINPYGNAFISLSINPKDSGDFDIVYHLQKIPIAMFNPYIITYTSYPFDRGTIELEGKWNVRDGIVQSKNHLLIIDPRVTKRIINKDTKWIPTPFIMSFIRERGNVIDYEIPITGDLKDPKFHFRDVILDVLKNIFVKPVTMPYRMVVMNAETEIEKSLTVKWKMQNSSLERQQKMFIEEMAVFLSENPDARITIYPMQYSIKEIEYILYFEAKKKFFMISNNKTGASFSKSDSEKVEKMSVKDSLFIQYLNKQPNIRSKNTVQEKCAWLINSNIADAKLKQLYKDRENTFLSFFIKKGVEKQLSFKKGEEVVPYNGFSFYKIDYKGEYPESLLNAFELMNELNEKAPRKKFFKDRKKTKAAFKQ